MLNIDRALENERLLRALTGLNRKAFAKLCAVLEVVYQEQFERDPKPRQRAKGGDGKLVYRASKPNYASSCALLSVIRHSLF